MIKPLLLLSSLLSLMAVTVNAQTDTSNYDLGRISVKKDFTQSVTIKGSDLQRYQFSDLADAINVWLDGTYTNGSTLVYVVDGNIITDVNAYSIFDVDEITLVQNAMAQVSGASPGQQMVLIKLRTNRPGKQGLEAAGQSSIVNLANRNNNNSLPGAKSTTNIYDQYYISGYKNLNNAHFGLSADYQHDVMPQITNSIFKLADPFHFDRIKLNAYADANLWKGTSLNFGINYTPQTSSSAFDVSQSLFDVASEFYSQTNVTQHLGSSNIAINSLIVKGLTNTLSAAYSHYNYFERDSLLDNMTQQVGSPASVDLEIAKATNKVSNTLIRDNLVYHTNIGIFDVEPSVNFSFRNFHDFVTEAGSEIQGYGSGGSNGASEYEQDNGEEYKLYLLSPSLDVSYKDMFDIRGGFVRVMNAAKDFSSIYRLQRSSPFLSAMVDIGKLSGFKTVSLRIFGSFSQQQELLNDNYASLAGFEIVGFPVIENAYPFAGSGPLPNYPFAYVPMNPFQQYNNYQAGAVLGLGKNFTVDYNFEDHYYEAPTEIEIPAGANSVTTELIFLNDKAITNRVGLNYNFNAGGFTWRTGLSAAETKLQVINPYPLGTYFNTEYLNSGHRWSGGFTNRFSYKTFFAGLDILYQLGERPYAIINGSPYTPDYVVTGHANSFSLQSLYFGKQIKITRLKYAEAFVNTRNILQNPASDITDNRRFYGFGFKVGL